MSTPAPYFELVLRVPLTTERRRAVTDEAMRLALELDGTFQIRKVGTACGRCRRCGSSVYVNEAGTFACLDCGALVREEVLAR